MPTAHPSKLQAVATSGEEQDLYLRVKAAEKQIEFITIQVRHFSDTQVRVGAAQAPKVGAGAGGVHQG